MPREGETRREDSMDPSAIELTQSCSSLGGGWTAGEDIRIEDVECR